MHNNDARDFNVTLYVPIPPRNQENIANVTRHIPREWEGSGDEITKWQDQWGDQFGGENFSCDRPSTVTLAVHARRGLITDSGETDPTFAKARVYYTPYHSVHFFKIKILQSAHGTHSIAIANYVKCTL